MNDKNPYEYIESILPRPIEEHWKKGRMSIESRIVFHDVEVQMKNEIHFPSSFIIKDAMIETYEELFKNESFESEQQVIVETDYGADWVSFSNVKDFFVETLSKTCSPTMTDFWILFPKSKLILASSHEGEIFRIDFKDSKITPRYRYQYRISSEKHITNRNRANLIGNKLRYEILLNNSDLSTNIQAELASEGLSIKEINKENYPKYDFLLDRESFKIGKKILKENGIDFDEKDRQKDKDFLKFMK